MSKHTIIVGSGKDTKEVTVIVRELDEFGNFLATAVTQDGVPINPRGYGYSRDTAIRDLVEHLDF